MSATSILINIGAQTAGAVRDIERVNTALGQQMTAADKTAFALKKMQGPALAALGAIGVGAAASVKAASDLGETMNAVNKVFGDGAKIITDFGEGSAESIGLSQRAFQELATSTGSLLTNMGQGTKEAANNTTELAQRAADMASVFNTDVGSALEAINAGFRGEAEPLRKYGVTLSDNAIKAEAMALGLYSGKGALDASARAAAVQSLIMEQTAATAGDFADTQDGVANSSRTVTAQMEDLAAQFGEVLLPYVEKGIGLFSSLLTWMSENETAVKVLVGTIGSLAAIVVVANGAMKAWQIAQTTASIIAMTGKVLLNTAATVAYHAIILTVRAAMAVWTAAQWALNAAMTANPIGIIIIAILALIAAAVLLWKNWDTVTSAFGKAWEWLKETVGKAWEGIKTAVSTGISAVVEFVKALPGKVLSGIGSLTSTLSQKGVDLLTGFVSGYMSVWSTVLSFAGDIASKVGGAIGSIGSALYGKGRDLIQGFVNGIKSMGNAILNAILGLLPNSIEGIVRRAIGFSSPRPVSGASLMSNGSRRSVGNVTFNLYGDQAANERVIKRVMEGYDVTMGRKPGQRLARAW